jgi:hypothetical protein
VNNAVQDQCFLSIFFWKAFSKYPVMLRAHFRADRRFRAPKTRTSKKRGAREDSVNRRWLDEIS